MRNGWHIIDSNGRRPARRWLEYWGRFDYGGDVIEEWPAFTQLICACDPSTMVRALQTAFRMGGVRLEDVTSTSDPSDGAIVIAQRGELLVVTEPGLDLDERRLDHGAAEAVLGLLARDGAFVGHDPACGLVHVTVFDLGAPTLAWFDSLLPGPSFARVFQPTGRATDEDPREYAIRMMQQGSTDVFDRYEFVCHLLEPLGATQVSPDLAGAEILRVLHPIDA